MHKGVILVQTMPVTCMMVTHIKTIGIKLPWNVYILNDKNIEISDLAAYKWNRKSSGHTNPN